VSITGFDEYPFHQQPTPLSVPVTTDAHFNDGYWFAFYNAGWYVVAGLRLHPNANVLDGFAAVVRNGRQLCVRASRALRPAYERLAVGPLRLEVLEPLRRLRLVLGENPVGLEFDVVFEARSPPFAEDRHRHTRYGVAINDTLRYTQVCRATGAATLGGERVEVGAWHAIRDHSWGVRSSMALPDPFGGVDRPAAERRRRAFRLWVPFEVEDHCGFFQTHEDRDGNAIDFEGRLFYDDGREVPLLSVSHALEYHANTKRPVAGSLRLIGEDGIERAYSLRSTGLAVDVQGLGYYGGWNDGYSAGVYRGADVIESDIYGNDAAEDPTGPPHVPLERRLGPTEHPSFLTGPEGAQGMAHLEHSVFGAYAPYSFS
jgi:hypothetical protein